MTSVGQGRRYAFAAGSVTWSGPLPLLVDHDNASHVGRIVDIWSGGTGLWVLLRFAAGSAGERAYANAVNRTRRGLSIGRLPEPFAYERLPDSTWLITRAVIREVSIVRTPVFPGARVLNH